MKGSDGISVHIRTYLFEKYENKCQICNWSIMNPFTEKFPLTVHHIDEDCRK
jgi:hypothetical protein